MSGMRTTLFLVLFSLMLKGAGAASCGQKRKATNRNEAPADSGPIASPSPSSLPVRDAEEPMNGEMRILAQGNLGVPAPFAFVARDAETYAALRRMVSQLPDMPADAFKSSAVVAAFLGQRRTGGYNVEMTRGAGGILSVSERKPPPGVMVTMALTAPYKVVAVPLAGDQPLKVELDETWRAGLRPYRLTTGEFTMSGGIAGRMEQFSLGGEIHVMRHEALATLLFSLNSTGGARARALSAVAGGIVSADSRLVVPRLDAGTFIESPPTLLRAEGSFADNGARLSLDLTSLPSGIPDSFSGQGRLEAVATGPAPSRGVSQ